MFRPSGTLLLLVSYRVTLHDGPVHCGPEHTHTHPPDTDELYPSQEPPGGTQSGGFASVVATGTSHTIEVAAAEDAGGARQEDAPAEAA